MVPAYSARWYLSPLPSPSCTHQSHFMGGSGELVFSSVGNRLGCELALWNEVPIKEYPDNENEVRCCV